jgi:4-amino-4-deoxy-L-arabinose transferase-like glycosyltransferase
MSHEPCQRRAEHPGGLSPRYLLPAVLALSLLTRGGVLLVLHQGLAEDPDGYRRLAENLLGHGTLGDGHTPTAYRPPLYPLMLAGCMACGRYSGPAIGILHLAMGLATVWLVYVLGRRWELGPRPAALAAALVACDPILLAQSTQVMTETPAALLSVLALLSLTAAGRQPSTARAAVAGGCLALAALCRPALLLWTVAAAVVLPALVRPWSLRLKVLGGLTLAAVLVLSPWAIRNQLRFGRPILTTTHGGYTLLLGNNPAFYRYLRTGAWGSVWKAEEFSATWRQRAMADELKANRQAYAQAWENISREPGTFVYACLVRVGRLWSPLPHQVLAHEGPTRRMARYAVGLWYLVELPLAAVGVWAVLRRRRPSAWLWGLLLAGSLTAVHTLYWSDLRMRSPLMPAVALAAAAAICWLPSSRGLLHRISQPLTKSALTAKATRFGQARRPNGDENVSGFQ